MYHLGEAILLSLLLGAFLGLFYVLLRIMLLSLTVISPPPFLSKDTVFSFPLIGEKALFPPQKKRGRIFGFFVIFFFDIIFFLCLSFALSIFVYSVGGIFRLSYLTGAFFGFLIFYFTVGRLLFLFWGYVLFLLRVLLSYLFFFLFLPLRPVFRKISESFSKITLFFSKKYATMKEKREASTRRLTQQKTGAGGQRSSVSFRFPKE